jgi:hypothetical protein
MLVLQSLVIVVPQLSLSILLLYKLVIYTVTSEVSLPKSVNQAHSFRETLTTYAPRVHNSMLLTKTAHYARLL